MTGKQKPTQFDEARHLQQIRKSLAKAPWALRVTEHKDKPVPVMIVKERILPQQRVDTENLVAPRSVLSVFRRPVGNKSQWGLEACRKVRLFSSVFAYG